MPKGGDPSQNLLAQAGLVTNEGGRVFEPPCGRLELPWMLTVSKETARQARQHFEQSKALDADTRLGWFVVSTEAEFTGLRYLLEKDWRRALQCWKGTGFFQLHNRATLHRALFFAPGSERPDAHLRECLRLYYHLSELDPKQTYYRAIQEELVDELKQMVQRAHDAGDDESCSRSLKILAQTVGMVAVSHLQESFFGRELEGVLRNCARVQKELLGFQGVAQAPPPSLLDDCVSILNDEVIPEAARFTHKLVEGSKEREEMESLVAQTCGVLSQSYVKAGDNRAAKKWMGEALRWEPKAVEDWRSMPEETFYEHDVAEVHLPEAPEEEKVQPRYIGSKLLGIQPGISYQVMGEAREEWVESLYIAHLPLVPLKRFAAYRNLDTFEVGYFVNIPLKFSDFLRQGLAVLAVSFVLSVGGVIIYEAATEQQHVPLSESEQQEMQNQIHQKVEELKNLAQREAKLDALKKPTKGQAQELEAIRQKRVRLIGELQKLENGK